MKKSILTALFVILQGIMPCGYAEIPNTINYQGYLSDPSGNPVEGATDIKFSIPGSLWVEEHTGVLVKQGVFRVQLGNQMPLAGVDFTQGPEWLQIEVDGTSQTVPLSSVPYAFHAKTVEQGNVESGILDYGEMESDSNRYPKLTLTKTITLSEDGIIILSGYAQARSIYNKYSFGNAESSVWIRIDGAGCSADSSIKNKSNVTFHSAASCIKELLAGSHTIEVKNETQNAFTEETRMSWVVFAKKRDSRSEYNSNVGKDTPSPQDKLEVVAIIREHNAAKEQQLIDQKSATIAEQQEKIATLEAMMQRMNRQMAALNQTVDALKAAVQLIPPQQQPQAVHTHHH